MFQRTWIFDHLSTLLCSAPGEMVRQKEAQMLKMELEEMKGEADNLVRWSSDTITSHDDEHHHHQLSVGKMGKARFLSLVPAPVYVVMDINNF